MSGFHFQRLAIPCAPVPTTSGAGALRRTCLLVRSPRHRAWSVAVHSDAVRALSDPDEDFSSHYRNGGDPDRDCPRLYSWHRALWGRFVPGIADFQLDVIHGRGFEMSLRAGDGSKFRLASDGIVPTWSSPGWTRSFRTDLVAEVAKDTDDFYRVASTVGGYILFPRNRMGQTGRTINQARGVDPRIADRFDLTLECIRRHYLDPLAENPLGERLAYYADFFSLFGDFDGYARFFLLDDLLTSDRSAVRSLMSGEPLSAFVAPAFAVSPTEYGEYRQRSIAFVKARNGRILQLGVSPEQSADAMHGCSVCAAAIAPTAHSRGSPQRR